MLYRFNLHIPLRQLHSRRNPSSIASAHAAARAVVADMARGAGEDDDGGDDACLFEMQDVEDKSGQADERRAAQEILIADPDVVLDLSYDGEEEAESGSAKYPAEKLVDTLLNRAEEAEVGDASLKLQS